MKEHLLPTQLNELGKEKFYTFFPSFVVRDDWATYHNKKITIPKVIEIIQSTNNEPISIESIPVDTQFSWKVINGKYIFFEKELIDALFKILLKNINWFLLNK